jgi:hypothetical protein
MNALDELIAHAQATQYAEQLPDVPRRGYYEMVKQAAAESAAMRQLISEQMEHITELQDKLTIKTLENLKGQSVLDDAREEIKQMRVVIDAAGAFAVTDSPDLPDDSRCAVIVSASQIRALAAAMKALPQPITKGTHNA